MAPDDADPSPVVGSVADEGGRPQRDGRARGPPARRAAGARAGAGRGGGAGGGVGRQPDGLEGAQGHAGRASPPAPRDRCPTRTAPAPSSPWARASTPARVGERVWLWEAAWQRSDGTAQELVAIAQDHAVPLPAATSFDVGRQPRHPRHDRPPGPDRGRRGPRRSARSSAAARVWWPAGRAPSATPPSNWPGGRRHRRHHRELPEKAALARAAGAHHVVNYRDRRRRRGHPATSPPMASTSSSRWPRWPTPTSTPPSSARNGTVAIYASEGDSPLAVPVRPAMTANVRYQFILVYTMPDAAKRRAVHDVSAAVSAGALDVGEEAGLPLHRFPLERTADAHAAVEAGAVGKVLIDVAPRDAGAPTGHRSQSLFPAGLRPGRPATRASSAPMGRCGGSSGRRPSSPAARVRLLLQVAHPRWRPASSHHSDFESDPLGRLRRTLDTMLTVAFGDRAQAEAAVAGVAAVHAHVRGPYLPGRRPRPRPVGAHHPRPRRPGRLRGLRRPPRRRGEGRLLRATTRSSGACSGSPTRSCRHLRRLRPPTSAAWGRGPGRRRRRPGHRRRHLRGQGGRSPLAVPSGVQLAAAALLPPALRRDYGIPWGWHRRAAPMPCSGGWCGPASACCRPGPATGSTTGWPGAGSEPIGPDEPRLNRVRTVERPAFDVVAVVGSAGGVDALACVLRGPPRRFPRADGGPPAPGRRRAGPWRSILRRRHPAAGEMGHRGPQAGGGPGPAVPAGERPGGPARRHHVPRRRRCSPRTGPATSSSSPWPRPTPTGPSP